jgi:FkbM family methyltransferase
VAVVKTSGPDLLFAVPNKTAQWRVDTFHTKEPETIAWIDRFSRGDLMLDIGANVGTYSVYAAAVAGARVIAFEPESQNYALLNENIFMNRLDDSVRAIPLAVSDDTGIDAFNLSSWGAGGSCHSTGSAIGFNGKAFKPDFVQGAFKVTLDSLSSWFESSAKVHLKVDVDGLEPNVIAGGEGLLEKRAFASVLIEINHGLNSHLDILRKMLYWGYRFRPDQVQSSMRTAGPFIGVANYVFYSE